MTCTFVGSGAIKSFAESRTFRCGMHVDCFADYLCSLFRLSRVSSQLDSILVFNSVERDLLLDVCERFWEIFVCGNFSACLLSFFKILIVRLKFHLLIGLVFSVRYPFLPKTEFRFWKRGALCT